MSLNEDATPAPGNTVAQAGLPGVEQLAYHRLARLRPRYRWWRMLLTGLVGIALYIAILLIVIVPTGHRVDVRPGVGCRRAGAPHDVAVFRPRPPVAARGAGACR